MSPITIEFIPEIHECIIKPLRKCGMRVNITLIYQRYQRYSIDDIITACFWFMDESRYGDESIYGRGHIFKQANPVHIEKKGQYIEE